MLPSAATEGARATGAEQLHGLMKEKGEGVLGQPLRLQISHLFHFQDKAAALTES